MSIPTGTGSYLMLVDYGSEGYGIQRYETEGALLAAILAGTNGGSPFLTARELTLSLQGDAQQGGKS